MFWSFFILKIAKIGRCYLGHVHQICFSTFRGIGTAMAGAALAAPLFSIIKKKIKQNGKKVEKCKLVS